jgi:ABC-type bacteriocin/lantibiotic exporter with double-glycine peptidase domain
MFLAGSLLAAIRLSAALGASGLWLDVPYVHQEKDGCGSASLAMVMRYWESKKAVIAKGRSDPAQIQAELYSKTSHGIYTRDIERYLRASGFDEFSFRGEWKDLRVQIEKGRPLIAGLKPRSGPAHYVVIVGCAPGDEAVLINDPERGKLLRIEREEFENSWRGTDNWTVLAVPHSLE